MRTIFFVSQPMPSALLEQGREMSARPANVLTQDYFIPVECNGRVPFHEDWCHIFVNRVREQKLVATQRAIVVKVIRMLATRPRPREPCVEGLGGQLRMEVGRPVINPVNFEI